MKILNKILIVSTITALCLSGSLANEGSSNFVPISKGVKSIDISLNDENFTIMRNQSKTNKISPLYETTFRGMPQPMILSKGVETVGELEFIDFMKKAQSDKNITIVDSRKPGWFAKLRIPGAINIPYTGFSDKDSAIEAMEDDLDVIEKEDGTLDFSKAKVIVAYCNGYWCGQTPAMIKNSNFSLLNMGYPASKIKYYRGGMQAWTSLGFTVTSDEN